MNRSSLSILTAFCLVNSSAFADDFIGAKSVLDRVAEAAKKPASPDSKPDAARALVEKLKAFSTDALQLAPAEAAEKWLALFDAYAATPAELLYSRNVHLTMESLLQSLPPTAAWDAVATGIEQRAAAAKSPKAAALKLLASVLREDTEAQKVALAMLKKEPGDGNLRPFGIERILEQLDEALAEGNPKKQGERFTVELTQLETPRNGYSTNRINVPELIKAVGEEQAKALLKRAVVLPVELSIEDEATRLLAIKILMQTPDKIRDNHWSLAAESYDPDLYAALNKKFPTSKNSGRSAADGRHLIALVVSQRTKEAADFAIEAAPRLRNGRITDAAARMLKMAGFEKQLIAFFREVLTRDPSLPYWGEMISLSAEAHDSKGALEWMRAMLARKNVAGAVKATLDGHYARALLAADEIEEGVSVLRALVKSYADVAPAPRAKNEGDSGELSQALMLASIGRLLEKPELVGEGIAAAKLAATRASSEGSYSDPVREVCEALVHLGRYDEAEAMIAARLIQDAVPNERSNSEYSPTTNQHLVLLAGIYHTAGRHTDVIYLLEHATGWGATDLGDVSSSAPGNIPLSYIAAKALAATGQQAEARRVVERTLDEKPGFDPAYELLLELGGDSVRAVIDRCKTLDRFEERPLIWAAKLELSQGRVDEAEKTIRAAIAIDPSDGEQGKGTRMRAYAILGDILEKNGDTEQAATMRGAVAAIRISEDGDDWWAAGLLSRAVKKYEEALTRFADAYCIQSRLALRYSELGDYEKAETHYRRAFELMPDSFGRVESHCFGCEGAFSGERAQGIAEKVFTALAEKSPTKPQVHYLLGYLRDTQEKYAEAAEQYRKAVALDPDYLNAWNKLIDCGKHIELPDTERENASLAILRLDPSGKRQQIEARNIKSVRKLWDTILGIEKSKPAPLSGPVFLLLAEKAAADATKDGSRSFRYSSRVENLREHLTNNLVLRAFGALNELSREAE